MSRLKKWVASEVKVPSPNESVVDTADSTAILLVLMENMFGNIDSMIQTLEQWHYPDMAGV